MSCEEQESRRFTAKGGILLLLAAAAWLALPACLIIHTGVEPKPIDYSFVKRIDRPEKPAMHPQSVQTVELGFSVEGRPIEAYVLGEGKHTFLFLGGIHGDAPGGESILEGLREELKANPAALKNKRVVIIPCCNPDGLVVETRANANQVDLNRNFPSSDWGDLGEQWEFEHRGEKPASEPETLAILKAIDRYSPSLVLSFHAKTACVDYEGEGAKELAEEFSEICRLPVIRYGSAPGSLGSYVAEDLKKLYISLSLEFRHKRGIMVSYERERFVDALLVMLGIKSKEQISASFESQAESPTLFPTPTSTPAPAPSPTRAKADKNKKRH